MLIQILGIEKEPETVAILFAYLFGRINKSAYKEAIGDKEKAKRIWSRTVNSGYILKNCKLFAYAVHYNRSRGQSTSPAKFEIHKEDVAILRKLNLSHLGDYKAMSLFDYDNLEGSILKSKELKDYIGKFINKKMKYLMRSYGQDREELFGQLIQHSLYALRKHYPKYESDLHALNICKTSVHNAGVGIMQYWNRAKRKALIATNGSFQAVNVPFESLLHIGVDPEHLNDFRLNIQSLVALAERLKPRPKAYVQAAVGLHDEGLSMAMGMDNRDAAERWDYGRYLKAVREYYHITEEQSTRLFTNLKQHL